MWHNFLHYNINSNKKTPGRVYIKNGGNITVIPGYVIKDILYIGNAHKMKTYSLDEHFIEILVNDMPHFEWMTQRLPLSELGLLPAGINEKGEHLFLVKVATNNTQIYGFIREYASCEYFNISGINNCLEEVDILLNEGETKSDNSIH